MPPSNDPLALQLPDGWSPIERVVDVVEADGVTLHRAGLASESPAGGALGAAADWRGSPIARAGYELLERVGLLEASHRSDARFVVRTPDGAETGAATADEAFPRSGSPELWAFARSSGVALGASWASACEHAKRELVERDCVLRAWLGQSRPEAIALDLSATPFGATPTYDWCARRFSNPGHLDPELTVAGVFAFPRRPDAPLVFGYGARPALADALEAALSEAAQQLAFLWGEPIPTSAPVASPTPLCHLETYQVHARHAVLRRWLDEGHLAHRAGEAPRRADVRFVDLSAAWLGPTRRLAKATSEGALGLAFGRPPYIEGLPEDLRIHPIP